MSQITLESVLEQIHTLPKAEQRKLRETLKREESFELVWPPAPHRLIDEPDMRPAFAWLAEHARDYAGKWVALDGDRLIASGDEAKAVYALAKADGAVLPLVTLVEDPDAPPYVGF
jgi:hypothetical protein